MTELGGLQTVIFKRRWPRIADRLRIPRSARNREARVQALYYKYLVSFSFLEYVAVLRFCYFVVCSSNLVNMHSEPALADLVERVRARKEAAAAKELRPGSPVSSAVSSKDDDGSTTDEVRVEASFHLT